MKRNPKKPDTAPQKEDSIAKKRVTRSHRRRRRADWRKLTYERVELV
jgi:hypothetical protein